MSTYVCITFEGTTESVQGVRDYFNEDKLIERIKKEINWDSTDYDMFSFLSLLDITDEQLDERIERLKINYGDMDYGNKEHWLVSNAIYGISSDQLGTSYDIEDVTVSQRAVGPGSVLSYQGYVPEDDEDKTELFKVFCKTMDPSLSIRFSWENDYHAGGEYERDNTGELGTISEWDPPSSHQEYEDRGFLDDCVCNWDGDIDNWYQDCPRPEDEKDYVYKYVVKVNDFYEVLAANEEQAKGAVIAMESGYDMPYQTKVLTKRYKDDYWINADEDSKQEWKD